MYSIEGDSIVYSGQVLARKEEIIVDSRQQDRVVPDTVRAQLEVGDYVVATGEGRVLLVEEKRIKDLVNSWRSRRLQRQLRKMLQVNAEGVNVLGLRASSGLALVELALLDIPSELSLDLIKWQGLGGIVGFLPYDIDNVLVTLRDWRAILHPGQHLFSILAGEDRDRRKRKVLADLTPTARALARLFSGVGGELASRWAAWAGEDLVRALSMPEEEVRRATHAGVVRKLREVIGDRDNTIGVGAG